MPFDKRDRTGPVTAHGYNPPMISLRLLASTLLALALAACTATAPVQHNPLATWVPSPNQNARTPVIAAADQRVG